jgi:hypothetical protein
VKSLSIIAAGRPGGEKKTKNVAKNLVQESIYLLYTLPTYTEEYNK